MDRRNFLKGVLGYLAAVPFLGYIFKEPSLASDGLSGEFAKIQSALDYNINTTFNELRSIPEGYILEWNGEIPKGLGFDLEDYGHKLYESSRRSKERRDAEVFNNAFSGV